jgi:hypothetical protein
LKRYRWLIAGHPNIHESEDRTEMLWGVVAAQLMPGDDAAKSGINETRMLKTRIKFAYAA